MSNSSKVFYGFSTMMFYFLCAWNGFDLYRDFASNDRGNPMAFIIDGMLFLLMGYFAVKNTRYLVCNWTAEPECKDESCQCKQNLGEEDGNF